MIQRISKRFLSLLLVAVMVLALMPTISLPVFAAEEVTVTGLADKTIGLKADRSDVWTANGTAITGSIKSEAGGCGGDTAQTSKLVITNTRDVPVSLMFTYTCDLQGDNAAVSISGESDIASGNKVNRTLGAGDSIEVSITSGSPNNATSISITSIQFIEDKNITTTFVAAENGSYSVNGETITAETQKTQSSLTGYQLVAIPNDGYQFVGWYNKTDDSYFTGGQAATVYIPADCTVTAIFKPVGTTFEAGENIFDDLGDAMNYAANNEVALVTLLKDSSITGNYTIPAGVTLLIPFDSAKTLYTSAPGFTTGSAKVFRTLTMEGNSSLCVNGAISVGGRLFSASGSASGVMAGDYGMIRMNTNSSITVKSGGILYAWGFISGNGSVLAESGATVYEWYQITDFRGGRATSSMNKKVFPFSQYYVQNIETLLTLNAGAKEIVYTGLTAGGGNNTTAINFIGDDGMFRIISGSLSKIYDGSTDRIVYTVSGEATLNSLSLKLGGISVNSKNYVLPLTNNMTVNLASNSRLTINQNTALLAGVQANIASGAELLVADGTTVYIYDADEWIANAYTCKGKFCSVQYAPGKTYNRSEKDLTDVKVDINGTLTVAGAVYTTAGGANIGSSEGTGKYVQQNKLGTETITYQYTQSGSSVTAHEISITPAKLHNADGSYTETAKAWAGITIPYANGKWEIPVCDHQWDEGVITTEPGCVTDGVKTYTCTICKETKTEVIPATGHSWDEGVITTAPTCSDAGVKTYTCTVCSETKTEALDATGHTPVDVAEQPATCTEAGHTAGVKCSVCGATISGIEEILATGHTEVIDEAVAATCTTPGKTEGKHCSVCNEVLVPQEEIPAKGHSWDKGVITTSPTCSDAGVKTYTCTVCGETKTEVLDATGHTPVDVAEQPATCTEAGHTAGVKCSVCGATISGIEEILATGHTEVIDEAVAATCTTPGKTEGKHCSVCNEVLVPQEEIPAKGHTEVIDEAVAATCTESGKTEGKHCSVCNEILVAQEVIPAKGHVEEIRNVKEVTDTEDGYTGDTYCSVCNELLKSGEVIYHNGWRKDGDSYYFYQNQQPVTGMVRVPYPAADLLPGYGPDAEDAEVNVPGKEGNPDNYDYPDRESALFVFDENGVFQKDQCGVYDDNGVTRWINNGMLVWHAGLVKDGNDYRYFKRNGMVTSVETYVAKTNGLLKAAKYTFDAEGRLMKLEGLHEDLNGNLCYYVDYVKNYAGLVEVDGSYYYIASDLKAVKNCTYYVTKTNDLKPAGYYTFDADGKMVIKSGLVEENGDLYYYVDGAKTAAGLIEWEGNYYYIASNLKAVKDAKHYLFADKANGLKAAGWYWFNADGTMFLEGIREENGTKYYYKDGVKNYAGLIEISGEYYYVKSDCSVVCNRSYYVTKSNGLMPSATYTFGADGKMVIKNGIYREKLGDGNEYLFYYVNNVRQVNIGLVQLDDGSYIYVRSGANLAVGSYYVSKTNDLLPQGTYTFGADGKMIVNP